MPELIAQGPLPGQRWRRSLAELPCQLGRAAGKLAAEWDAQISRFHCELDWVDQQLTVRRLEDAHNPIFFRGRAADQFRVSPGEHFVIGETTFTLAVDRIEIASRVPSPVEQRSYSPHYLHQVRYRNPDQRMEVLSRLPEVIRKASDDRELLVRLVSMLLTGLPGADAVAVIETRAAPPPPPAGVEGAGVEGGVPPDAAGENGFTARILHWDRRLLGLQLTPSQSLIRQAVAGESSVLHVWSADGASSQFTQGENVDWAFCTPVAGEPVWALYVTGRFDGAAHALVSDSDPHDLRDDLKFAELTASTLGSLRELRRLERRHAGLSQFFSPVVLRSLEAEDPEVGLAPRECDVSVLFCDLRGFARQTEQSAHQLMELLERVSGALGVMTRQILEHGGVVGDFHGDAAMGFWGWPLPQADAVHLAGAAALGIRQEFERISRDAQNPLSDFRMGIGIAAGRAVAGKIGTVDQVKATVFGPVVNLASRLEGMTKILRAPILLDEVSARILRETGIPDQFRLRRVARVLPYGMAQPLEVSELLPPESQSALQNEHLKTYEEALDLLLDGDWPTAFLRLHEVPASDRVKDFLTVFIAQHNRTAPPGWNGVIPLHEK